MEKVINNENDLGIKIKERVKLSFENGYKQVPLGKAKEFKKRIMAVLSITDRGAFDLRMKGKSSYNQAEIVAVENIFKEYGVTNNIWTNVEKSHKAGK